MTFSLPRAGIWIIVGIGVMGPCAARAASHASSADDLEILEAVTDCRYLTTENPGIAFDSQHLGSVWFPQGDLFRPPLADMRQPRFYASWRRVTFEGEAVPSGGGNDTINAGVVGMGGDFGIWRQDKRRRCDGMQVGVTGAIFSQFNLDAPSDDLINSDFVVGPTFTLRRGNLSARFRLYHISSHLGDELILENPDIDRINLSIEIIDALVSYERSWWRVYGGLGYLTGGDPPWMRVSPPGDSSSARQGVDGNHV